LQRGGDGQLQRGEGNRDGPAAAGRTRPSQPKDATALEFTMIFCSGGRRGLEIELAPADLIRAAGAVVAAISRPGAGQAAC
jgi:hypothetical protein